jgi:MFS family permease
MADWTAVYLRSDLGTSEAFATAGYAAFSLAMAIGRLGGDRLTASWGPVAVVRRGGLTVAAALFIGLLLNQPVAAVIAFGAVGLGLSSIIPVAFSAAGQSRELAPGPAIATVSSLGYTGFLAGPPIIGFVAELVGLRFALGFVVLAGALMALLADVVAPEPERAAVEESLHPAPR